MFFKLSKTDFRFSLITLLLVTGWNLQQRGFCTKKSILVFALVSNKLLRLPVVCMWRHQFVCKHSSTTTQQPENCNSNGLLQSKSCTIWNVLASVVKHSFYFAGEQLSFVWAPLFSVSLQLRDCLETMCKPLVTKAVTLRFFTNPYPPKCSTHKDQYLSGSCEFLLGCLVDL